MTKAEKFQQVAVNLILKFTDGNYILRNVSSESYNTVSGVNTVGYNSTAPIKMVTTDIVSEKDLGDISSNTHFIVTAAGLHIQGFEPSIGDLIVIPDGTVHKIDKIKTDLYGASFEMFVNRKEWLA